MLLLLSVSLIYSVISCDEAYAVLSKLILFPQEVHFRGCNISQNTAFHIYPPHITKKLPKLWSIVHVFSKIYSFVVFFQSHLPGIVVEDHSWHLGSLTETKMWAMQVINTLQNVLYVRGTGRDKCAKSKTKFRPFNKIVFLLLPFLSVPCFCIPPPTFSSEQPSLIFVLYLMD